MNQLELPWWFGWIIAGGGIAFIVWYVIYNILKARIPWLPLPGYYAGAMYLAPKDVDPRHITRCLQYAETCLIEKTRFSAANLALVGHMVHVRVLNDNQWVDLWGRTVAGTAQGPWLTVGKSMSALCHELAHLCEKVIDNKVDAEHSEWTLNGIYDAVAKYQQWLMRGDTSNG